MSNKIRKPNKKQSAGNRRYQRIRGFIEHAAIAQVNNNPLCFIDLSQNKIRKPTELLCHAFIDIPHKWNIMLAVSCLEKNGKIKLVTDEFVVADKCHQATLCDIVNGRHQELIVNCNKTMEVRFVSWIASANGKQFDIEKIDGLFELMINKGECKQ